MERMCLGSRGRACGKYSNCALRIGRCWVWALWGGPRYSFRGTTTSSRAQGDSPRDVWPPALFVFCPLLPLVPTGGADWAKGGGSQRSPLGTFRLRPRLVTLRVHPMAGRVAG